MFVDSAEAAPKKLEFHLHILFASKQEGASEGVPEELKEVLAALKSTLSYRSYTLASTSVLLSSPEVVRQAGRAQADMVPAGSKGDRAPVPVSLDWTMSHLRMEPSASGPATLFMDFELGVLEPNGVKPASLSAVLRLKVGEKVVVGTTTLKDRGLIAVLTAKILD